MGQNLWHGIDAIEIERLAQSWQRFGLKLGRRIFTERELAYCLKYSGFNFYSRLSGRFAAKEAVAKALGSGFNCGIKWTDIEIINDELGKPTVVLHNLALNRLAILLNLALPDFNYRHTDIGSPLDGLRAAIDSRVEIALSLTHSKTMAVASCVILRKG